MRESVKRHFDKRETAKAKGIAISLLLFHHLFYSQSRVDAGGIQLHFIPDTTLFRIGYYARICVWCFVFLSAYGLTAQYLKMNSAASSRDRVRFIGKHWLSLMTPYWIVFFTVTLLSLFIMRRPWDIFEHNWLYAIVCFLGG